MKFTFDIKKATQQLELFKKASRQEIKTAMEKAALVIEDESVKRAPIDEGHLQNSHRHKVEQTDKTTSAIAYIPSNSPASDYALYMHEGSYSLGPASLQKQGSVGVRVGRKYLERALMESQDKIIAAVVRELKRNLK
jgi:hypothetical protein